MRYLLIISALVLSGCTKKVTVPVATEVKKHKPTGELIKKAKRPSAEKPADTPVKKVLKQGVNDRVVAGNEADRSDALRAVNCAEHDWDIRDKDGVNRCIEHKKTLDAQP